VFETIVCTAEVEACWGDKEISSFANLLETPQEEHRVQFKPRAR
jgi:hypothetical protein